MKTYTKTRTEVIVVLSAKEAMWLRELASEAPDSYSQTEIRKYISNSLPSQAWLEGVVTKEGGLYTRDEAADCGIRE